MEKTALPQYIRGNLQRGKNKGFTLVELLVVIAVVAILAAVVVIIINPVELTQRGRDAARLTDLANMVRAINVAYQENSGTPNFLCNGGSVPCSGLSTAAGANASNGTGWIKIPLLAQPTVKVPTLPLDQTNSTGATGFHYAYCGNATNYEISAKLESAKESPRMLNTKDGGNEDTLYEVGTDLTLIAPTGSCIY